MARLFADEDYHNRVTAELVALGHEVISVQSTGLRGINDPAVLAIATAQGRAVLTHNRRHFIRLHRIAQPHSGIVVCTRDDADPAALARRVHAALECWHRWQIV